jgi:hypothetical protein
MVVEKLSYFEFAILIFFSPFFFALFQKNQGGAIELYKTLYLETTKLQTLTCLD